MQVSPLLLSKLHQNLNPKSHESSCLTYFHLHTHAGEPSWACFSLPAPVQHIYNRGISSTGK
jgi:hypothetical protein